MPLIRGLSFEDTLLSELSTKITTTFHRARPERYNGETHLGDWLHHIESLCSLCSITWEAWSRLATIQPRVLQGICGSLLGKTWTSYIGGIFIVTLLSTLSFLSFTEKGWLTRHLHKDIASLLGQRDGHLYRVKSYRSTNADSTRIFYSIALTNYAKRTHVRCFGREFPMRYEHLSTFPDPIQIMITYVQSHLHWGASESGEGRNSTNRGIRGCRGHQQSCWGTSPAPTKSRRRRWYPH